MTARPRRSRLTRSAGPAPRSLRFSQRGDLAVRGRGRTAAGSTLRLARLGRPEMVLLAGLAAGLNLWGLSRNRWANEYYSAAVRSMSTSWHDFLFGSLDAHGVMTVDKPPLALWVQALSVRVFGFHPLSMLVPQALMGVASAVLVYDLVRRRFGRGGGFLAGLALALTPITVAISRHNNPDALLVLCCVAAVWFTVRGLEDGRTRWIVLAGILVGLGFEAKMGVALMVVPGIVVAWLWVGTRGRLAAGRQLLAGAAALVATGGAWPLLVGLTPAANRPWISGTSDNSILSLILNYNGLGRLDGQVGGPAGGGGGLFGGSPGVLRLFNPALAGQDGWLVGFALVCAIGIMIAARARRTDPRTGWIIAVGGTFLTIAVAFSGARGIFHPYYLALLAPFTAALVGAGGAVLVQRGRQARVLGPLAVTAGAAGELAVLHNYSGQLVWLGPLLIGAGAAAVVALAGLTRLRHRLGAVGASMALLLVGPAVWAADTLGYPASGVFPAGGPASAAQGAGPGAPGLGAGRRLFGGAPPPGTPGGGAAGGANGAPPIFGPGRRPEAPGGFAFGPGGPPGRPGGTPPGVGGPFAGGGPLNQVFISQVLGYTRQHGGGTVAVTSQSSAASAILSENADVAGIGGFSGRESQVTVGWLAETVQAGHLRWIVSDRRQGPNLPGDTRTGATTAVAAAARACRKVTIAGGPAESGPSVTVYDCQGRSAALRALAGSGA